jgi:hypothetical protein
MEVTGSYERAEERQINEGARVTDSNANRVLNSKGEWNQPPITRITVQTGNSQDTQTGDLTGNRYTRERGRGGRGRGRGGEGVTIGRGRGNRGRAGTDRGESL